VPITFYNRHIDDLIADKFHLKRNGCRIHKFRDLVEKYLEKEKPPGTARRVTRKAAVTLRSKARRQRYVLATHGHELTGRANRA
jgi:hypothetical protein